MLSALDDDGALGDQGGYGAGRGQNGRQEKPNRAHRERKFDERIARLVLDYDAAGIPLFDDLLETLDHILARDLKLFGFCLLFIHIFAVYRKLLHHVHETRSGAPRQPRLKCWPFFSIVCLHCGLLLQVLRDRLMVGQQTLNLFILVRIQVPQLLNFTKYLLKCGHELH